MPGQAFCGISGLRTLREWSGIALRVLCLGQSLGFCSAFRFQGWAFRTESLERVDGFRGLASFGVLSEISSFPVWGLRVHSPWAKCLVRSVVAS